MRIGFCVATIGSVLSLAVVDVRVFAARQAAPPKTVIAVSSDAVHYATVTAANTIEIRDRTQPASAPATLTITGPTEAFTALTFSGDGQYIAAASDDRKIRIWTVADGKTIRELDEPSIPNIAPGHPSHVSSIAFSRTGTELAIADDGLHWLVVYAGASPTDMARSVATITDVPLLAIASDGQGGWAGVDPTASFHFYDPRLVELPGTTSKALAPIRSIAVSPDGVYLATAGDDQQIKLWSFGSAATASSAGKFTLIGRQYAPKALLSVVFSADSKTIVYADNTSALRDWQYVNPETQIANAGGTPTNPATPITVPAPTIIPPTTNPTSPPPTTPTSTPPPTVASVGPTQGGATTPTTTTTNPTVPAPQTQAPPKETVTPPPTKETKATLTTPTTKGHTPPSHPKPPPTVASLPVEQEKATAAIVQHFIGHSDYVNSVAFSPDGHFVASGSRDKTVRLWDVATGSQIILGKHENYVSCVAFNSDGSLLASGGWDNHIKLFEVPSGLFRQPDPKLDKHTSYVLSLAFSPDGKYLASGSNDKTARVFSFRSGESKVTQALPDGIATIAFSPDGQRIAGGCLDGSVYVWETETMQLVKKLPGVSTKPVFSVVFLDNNSIVAGGRGGALHVWRLSAGKMIASIPAGGQDVFALAYSEKDHLLASGGADKVIRLWSASQVNQPTHSVSPLATLNGHQNTVRTVAFSADGTMMATGSWDDNVLTWKVKTSHSGSAAASIGVESAGSIASAQPATAP